MEVPIQRPIPNPSRCSPFVHHPRINQLHLCLFAAIPHQTLPPTQETVILSKAKDLLLPLPFPVPHDLLLGTNTRRH